jgi:hypothetical protein
MQMTSGSCGQVGLACDARTGCFLVAPPERLGKHSMLRLCARTHVPARLLRVVPLLMLCLITPVHLQANARVFNEPGSQFYDATDELSAAFEESLQKLVEGIRR